MRSATTRRPTRRPARFAGLATALLSAAVGAGTTVGVTTLTDATPAASAATAKATTRLDMNWGDTTPVAGRKVLLYGFAFPGSAGRVLHVQTLSGSPASWRTVGRVTTVSNGSFTVYLQHTVAGSHRYRLYAPATTSAGSARSATATFTVSKRATVLSAAVSAASVVRGTSASVSGSMTPDFTARTVTLQRRVLGTTAWSTLSAATLNASSRYTFKVPTGTVGSWQYRAVTGPTRYAEADTSATRSFRVTRP